MVTGICLKKVKPEELYVHILPRVTRNAFLLCSKLPFLARSQWYLAGGTALTLNAGHRQSVDLDFFTPENKLNMAGVEQFLLKTKLWTTSFREKGTLYGTFKNAKMSFIAYPFFIPSKERICCGNIKMLLPGDIATMKIIAISQRGRKRDFLDLYWYCINKEPLAAVLKRVKNQYPGQERNMNHILRSLIYFDDAESDPMPRIFFKTSWNEIKKFFRNEAVKLTRALLF